MKKQIAAVTAFLMLLTSCAANNSEQSISIAPSPASAIQTKAMGRYIEEDITPGFCNASLSPVFTFDCGINTGDDNVLHYYGYNVDTFTRVAADYNGEWSTPVEIGTQWLKPAAEKLLGEKTDSKPVSENGLTVTKGIAGISNKIGPAGNIFTPLYYLKYTSDDSTGKSITGAGNEFTHQYYISYGKDGMESYDIEELTQKSDVSFNDFLQELEQAGNSYNFNQSRITRDQVLILPVKNSALFYKLDGGKAQLLGEIALPENENVINNDNTFIPLIAASGDIAFVCYNNMAAIYSLSSGKKLSEVELPEMNAVCEGPDGSFYAAGKSGVWRVTNGGIAERVIDGATSAYAAPSRRVHQIAMAQDGTFYILTRSSNNMNENINLYKYSFSVSTPLEREKTFYVWTLRSSPTLTETAAEFMRLNPDVKVYLEAVDTPESPENEAKAYEAMCENVKNGKGPDIIVTDGLNLNTLYKDGIIKELPQDINFAKYDETLLQSGKIDGKLAAVSGRIKLPVAMPTIDEVKSMGVYSLAELEPTLKNESVELSANTNNILYEDVSVLFADREQLLQNLYLIAAGEIWRSGNLNQDTFKVYLSLCKQLDEKFLYSKFADSNSNIDSKYKAEPRGKYALKIWGVDVESISGNILKMYDLLYAGMYKSAAANMANTLAVSSCVSDTGLASAFIQTLISDNVQSCELGDGTAVTDILNKNYGYEKEAEYLTSFMALPIEKGINKHSEAEIPVVFYHPVYKRDNAVKQITQDYLNGKITLESAIEAASNL